MMIKTAAAGCATYIAIAVVAFGGLMQPLSAIVFADRLTAPYWELIVFACLLVGALSFLLPARLSLLRLPLFLATGFLGSLFFVGSYVDHLRNSAVIRFGADRSFQNSFVESVRNAPDEPQFFLHAGAIKNCVPYGWSYRTMRFYRIPERAAINVMPHRWLVECSINRL